MIKIEPWEGPSLHKEWSPIVHLDVVHNLGLEESLGGVIHDLVAQLGLGDVLTELLDAGAGGRGAILVDDLCNQSIEIRQKSAIIFIGLSQANIKQISGQSSKLTCLCQTWTRDFYISREFNEFRAKPMQHDLSWNDDPSQ